MRESALDTGPSFGVVAGWDSRMVYHGEDWIQKGIGSQDDSNSAGIYFARATVEWKGFAAFVGYLQSDQEVNPRDIRTDSEYYAEIQTGISYTYGIIPDALDASIGYNAYFVNSEAFLGHSYNGEAYVRLAYKKIPFITPSISAFYLHGDSGTTVFQPGASGIFDVEGFIYEARVDGNFKLFNIGSEGFVALNPFVNLVIDGGFWSDETFEFNTLQYGLNVPIAINNKLSFNLHINYYQALRDRTGLIAHPEFWGGASVAYRF